MRILFLFLTVLILNQGIAQQTYRVQRGERPEINLDAVPENAYHKGVIKIKLQESYTQLMDEMPATVSNGTVVFGIPAIDQLIRQYGISNFGKTFSSPAFTAEFAERHRAWGFHLWYYLYFDESVDVINLVRKFDALSAVMIAEPEYVKVPVYTDKPMGAPENFSFKGPAWTPDDPRYDEQWHYHNTGQQNGTVDADIDLPEAWEITKGNSEVIVAIVDEGVAISHPDIAANMWSGIGYNFVNNSSTISPGDHGAHVAGTVAGVNNNGVGIAGVAGGTGPGDGVRLMSCQVFTNSSSGGFHNAPVYAADNGAAISQNSWGYTSPNNYDQNVLDAIDYFNINGGGDAMVDGGITIFAAGNSNSQGNYYPGYYSGTFSVAATNNQDKKAWYSNYGTWVDISAPGGETNQVTTRGVLSCWRNNNYGFYEGTSMACPHVSGIAALMVSLAYGQLTPQQIVDIIQSTSDDHYGVNPGFIDKLGAGRANAHSALLETLNQMILVNNPLAFTALPENNTQINLNWVKNSENDDVMIAWNTSDTFGDPVQEQAYEAGDNIEGGGTILYKGSATSFQHTDLSSNTPYFYKAWSLNDVPEYSPGLAAAATTLKDPITTFPYLQGFDDEIFPPASWENKKLAGAGAGIWDRQTTGANPVCEPQNGAAMARFNSNFYQAGTSGLLVSPPVMFGNDDYEISFWIYRDNDLPAVADKVEIFANLTPSTGFATLLGTVHRSTQLSPVTDKDGWHLYTYELPATYKDKLAYIVLKGNSELGNNLFVDEFLITIPVSCFPPVDLAVSEVSSASANISWTGVEPATAWDVEYGPAGFEPGNGTLITGVLENTLSLSELEADASYDVYVRGACDDESTSNWAGPVSFATLCFANTPWDETFEALNSGFDCWQVLQNTAADGGLNGNNLVSPSGNTWFVCTPESFGNNGADYIYAGSRSAAIESSAIGFNWLVTGEIMMPAADQTDLSFRLKFLNDEANPTRFHVNVLSNGAWSTLMSWTSAADVNNYQLPVHLNMVAFNGQTIRLAFVYEDNNGHILAIDNISLMPATNYWTGNGNSNWNDAANWRLSVPASGHTADVFPSANQPEISGTLSIEGVNIHPGASLTLLPDAKVTVNGTITNNAGNSGLVLKASTEMQASLILNQETVPASVEFMTEASGNIIESSLMAFPVTGQEIAPLFTGNNDHMLKWNAASSSWISLKLEGGVWNPEFEAEFQSGSGYIARFGEAGTRVLSGNLTGSSVDANLTASSGWHLIGNPYTSSVEWNGNNNDFSSIIKMYNAADGSFEDVLPMAVLPAMTGFFVSAEPGSTPAYTFDPSHRTHSAASSSPIQGEGIALSVSETTLNTTQHSRIIVASMATAGYDRERDSRFLAGFAPQLYSIAGDEMLSLNSIPSVASGNVIQLGFVKNDASNYTLQIDADELFPGMILYLHDKKTATIQDLNGQSTYTFTAEAGDDANRFELIFGTLGINDNNNSSEFMVFANNGIIEIRSTNSIKGDIKITGLDGRTAISLQGNGSNNMKIDAGKLANGIYVVSLMNSNGITTRKVMVK